MDLMKPNIKQGSLFIKSGSCWLLPLSKAQILNFLDVKLLSGQVQKTVSRHFAEKRTRHISSGFSTLARNFLWPLYEEN